MDRDAVRELAARLAGGGRLLLCGPPGTGKSTLVTALADAAAAAGEAAPVLSADPGQPPFGPPGAAALARRLRGGWELLAVEGIATLDAARFRVPLVEAVRRLAARVPSGPLLLDAPGVFRGVAAAELLPALARAAGARRAVALLPPGAEPGPLPDLEAAGLEVVVLRPHPAARPLTHPERIRRRTAAWKRWMAGATGHELDLGRLAVAGTPPPRTAPGAWRGRLAAVLDREGATLILGEVVALEGDRLLLRSPAFPGERARAVAVRDAVRDGRGLVVTAPRHRPAPPPHGAEEVRDLPILLPAPRPPHATRLRGTLVGGLFGDPLLVLVRRDGGGALLVDLGEHPRLPVRLAHRTRDVLLTHGHVDHVWGLPWLVRRLIGVPGRVRIWGPPGTAARLASLLAAVVWDRIGEDAPELEVGETDGTALRRFLVRAGDDGPHALGEAPLGDATLFETPDLAVRVAVLDHGIPVLAYAIAERDRLQVRADRIAAEGLPEGPWIGALRRAIAAGSEETPIEPPGRPPEPAGALAARFLERRPGQTLVYATDLADTPANREALIRLARGAQLLVLEAAFLEADAARARATGHLTARACGEIAAAAGVERLLPFHLSPRYRSRPGAVLAEVAATGAPLWLPPNLRPLLPERPGGTAGGP